MLRPLADRVFVRPVRPTEERASGLVVLDDGSPDTVGDVVAVGETVTAVRPGDRVLIAPMSGIEATFNHGEEEYIILGEDEILGVFE
jgi:co-chaperonin GroES (HSP10)